MKIKTEKWLVRTIFYTIIIGTVVPWLFGWFILLISFESEGNILGLQMMIAATIIFMIICTIIYLIPDKYQKKWAKYIPDYTEKKTKKETKKETKKWTIIGITGSILWIIILIADKDWEQLKYLSIFITLIIIMYAATKNIGKKKKN